jgi:hypothetical protein
LRWRSIQGSRGSNVADEKLGGNRMTMIAVGAAAVVAVIVIIVLIVVLTGNGDDDQVGISTATASMNEMNQSGYRGEVLLASAGDNRTLVTIAIGEGETLRGNFPTAIHRGSCEGLAGEQVHDLGELQNGLLTTEVSTPLSELEAGDYAVVVFQAADRAVYVACGDI